MSANTDCRDKLANQESSDSSWHDDPGAIQQDVMGSSSVLMHGQVNDPEHVPVSPWRSQAGVGLTAQAGSIMVSAYLCVVIMLC